MVVSDRLETPFAFCLQPRSGCRTQPMASAAPPWVIQCHEEFHQPRRGCRTTPTGPLFNPSGVGKTLLIRILTQGGAALALGYVLQPLRGRKTSLHLLACVTFAEPAAALPSSRRQSLWVSPRRWYDFPHANP